MKSKMKRRNRQIEKAKKKQKDSQRAQIHRILDLVLDRVECGQYVTLDVSGYTKSITLWTNTTPGSNTGLNCYHHYFKEKDIGVPLFQMEEMLCRK